MLNLPKENYTGACKRRVAEQWIAGLRPDLLQRLEERTAGSWRGVVAYRERLATIVDRIASRVEEQHPDHDQQVSDWRAHQQRRQEQGREWLVRRLTVGADVQFDEHRGYDETGDFRKTSSLDYVSPQDACEAPYCDHGRAGMALIEVTRERWYRRSYHSTYGWHPSTATERYLVGRNEIGTYYAHRVSDRCDTVREAVGWIWRDQEDRIVARQGDVALITGNGGPRVPRGGLPAGHVPVEWARVILHETHPPIPMPGKGQRILVGRRAAQRGHGATTQTRD